MAFWAAAAPILGQVLGGAMAGGAGSKKDVTNPRFDALNELAMRKQAQIEIERMKQDQYRGYQNQIGSRASILASLVGEGALGQPNFQGGKLFDWAGYGMPEVDYNPISIDPNLGQPSADLLAAYGPGPQAGGMLSGLPFSEQVPFDLLGLHKQPTSGAARDNAQANIAGGAPITSSPSSSYKASEVRMLDEMGTSKAMDPNDERQAFRQKLVASMKDNNKDFWA